MVPLGWAITAVKSATSTSDLAKQAARDGASSGSGFLAVEQTAGRGRLGRQWSSQKGGMYLSVVLRPTISRDQWFGVSFVASLAVLATIRDVLAANSPDTELVTGLKWPNDVLVSGGKIAGILLEADAASLIVGSGINIAPVGKMASARVPPIALADCIADSDLPDPEYLAGIYINHLAYWYECFQSDGFAPIRIAWLEAALFLHQRVKLDQGDTSLEGVFCDLCMDGTMLLLDDSGKNHHITTGDVQLVGG